VSDVAPVDFGGVEGCHVSFDSGAGPEVGLFDAWAAEFNDVVVVAVLVAQGDAPPALLRDARAIATSLRPTAT
jgi:hypothetical protein